MPMIRLILNGIYRKPLIHPQRGNIKSQDKEKGKKI